MEKDGHGSAESETITGPERLTEVLMMGLRLSQGLSEADLQRAAGVTWDEAIDGDILEHLVETGFLEHDELAVRATPRGRQVLNSVLERLLI